MNKTNKAFTLIELLVVIAIIGILSGLLIVSMSGATNSAKDARIKSEMDQLRTTALIFYTNNSSSYTGFAAATDAASLLTDINNQGGTNAIYTAPATTAYCVVKQLISSTTAYWCIDSTGYAGTPTSSTTCSATTTTCK
jgi:prepilin-type N-terminal cleavage/methylation domain-containing protein